VKRRAFLVSGASALGLSALGLAGCSRPATRADVLAGLVERIAVPDLERIVRASAALESAVAALGAADAAALERARKALRAALLAWQRAHAFRQGPVVDSHALLRATFWPARPAAIATLIQSPRVLDASRVAELGVDVKGVFALEHLLFEGPEPGASWLAGEHGARGTALARVLASDVRNLAERAARELGDGSAFARKLADGGQASLNRLVNELLATIETAAVSRVDRVLGLRREGMLARAQLQGGPSGLSAHIPRTWIDAGSDLYDRDGRGLGELVRTVAPAIDSRVRETFGRASAALQKLDAPLEQLVVREPARLEHAVRALRDLEVAIKADLAGALGVTLTFTSSDGD
jgi:predicted lipoprotein